MMNMAIFLFRTVIQACYSIEIYRKLCLGVMMRIATVVGISSGDFKQRQQSQTEITFLHNW